MLISVGIIYSSWFKNTSETNITDWVIYSFLESKMLNILLYGNHGGFDFLHLQYIMIENDLRF